MATAIVPFGVLAFFPSGYGGDLASEPPLLVSRGASLVLLALFLLQHIFLTVHPHRQEEFATDRAQDLHAPFAIGSHLTTSQARPAGRSGKLNKYVAIAVMGGTVTLTYFCASPMLSATAQSLPLSRSFTGFCLLPLLAEIAEISRICRLAWTDRMEEVLEAAAGTSIQTALFVAPILCLLGWCLDQPMSLSLTLLELVSFGASIWIFGYLIQDGKSNYMEGAMSIGL